MEIQQREVDINGKLKNRTVGTIEIDFEGKKEKVEILELNFGEDLSIRQKHTKVSNEGGKPVMNVNQEAITYDSLVKSIITAPFEITKEAISELSKSQARVILEAFNELNNPEEKKNLN